MEIKYETCRFCKGYGTIGLNKCKECRGKGQVAVAIWDKCKYCGESLVGTSTCPKCGKENK